MLFNILSGLMPKFYLAEGEGDLGGGGGAGAGNEGNQSETVTISKTELAELKGNAEQLQKDLDETQANLLDPDYLEFQATKGKGGGKPKEGADDDAPPAKPVTSEAADPFKDFTDEQLESMSPRKQAALIQKSLSGAIVPAIVDSLKRTLLPTIKNSVKADQEAEHTRKVVVELQQLVKEGKDVKAVKDQMEVLAELHEDWGTRKVYDEAVKLKRAQIMADGRELTDKEKKALALAESDKPAASGGSNAVHEDKDKTFKTDDEAAEDAFEKSGLKA